MNNLSSLLSADEYSFIAEDDKRFIVEFDTVLENMGYRADGITDGICWGRYMLIYRRSNVKSKTVYARIYIRDDGICLRLFLSSVTKHAEYIDNTPDFIKTVFTGEWGKCKHCRGDNCRFRKDYEINGVKYEKCNGLTFEFFRPTLEQLPEYIGLFREFFNIRTDR